jgi:hypothetical protein
MPLSGSVSLVDHKKPAMRPVAWGGHHTDFFGNRKCMPGFTDITTGYSNGRRQISHGVYGGISIGCPGAISGGGSGVDSGGPCGGMPGGSSGGGSSGGDPGGISGSSDWL